MEQDQDEILLPDSQSSISEKTLYLKTIKGFNYEGFSEIIVPGCRANQIVYSTSTNSIKIWDLRLHQNTTELITYTSSVSSMFCSINYVIAGFGDGSLICWRRHIKEENECLDNDTYEIMHKLQLGLGVLKAIHITTDEKYFIVHSWYNVLCIHQFIGNEVEQILFKINLKGSNFWIVENYCLLKNSKNEFTVIDISKQLVVTKVKIPIDSKYIVHNSCIIVDSGEGFVQVYNFLGVGIHSSASQIGYPESLHANEKYLLTFSSVAEELCLWEYGINDSYIYNPIKSFNTLTSHLCATISNHYLIFEKACDIEIWELSPLECLGLLKGHTQNLIALCISESSKKIISSGKDHTIRIWSMLSLSQIYCITCTIPLIIFISSDSLVFSPHPGTLLTLSLITSEENLVIRGHQCGIYNVCISHNRKYLFTLGDDWYMILWDYTTLAQLAIFGKYSKMKKLSVTSDDRYAMGYSENQTFYLWDLINFTEITALSPFLRSFTHITDSGSAYKIHFPNKTVEWDPAEPRSISLRRLRSGVSCIYVTADQKHIAIGYEKGLIKIATIEDNKEEEIQFSGHLLGITAIYVTDSKQYLISASLDFTLVFWNFRSFAKESVLGLHAIVTSVALTEATRLLTLCTRHTWYAYSLPELQIELQMPNDIVVTSICVNHTGRYAIGGTNEGYAFAWEIQSGRLVLSHKLSKFKVTAVAIEDDLNNMIVYSQKCILIVNCNSFITKKIDTGIHISILLVSCDRTTIMYCPERTSTFHFYSLEKSKGYELDANETSSQIKCCCISYDNNYFVTSFHDFKLMAWDIRTKTRIGYLLHKTYVKDAVFDGQSHNTISCSSDSIKVWNIHEASALYEINITHVKFIKKIESYENCIALIGSQGELKLYQKGSGKDISDAMILKPHGKIQCSHPNGDYCINESEHRFFVSPYWTLKANSRNLILLELFKTKVRLR